MPARKKATRKPRKTSKKKGSKTRRAAKPAAAVDVVPPSTEYRVRLGHEHAEVVAREAEKAGVAPSALLERALASWLKRRA